MPYGFYIKMFNVSALLLDDALKLVTPLTNGTINDSLWQFAPLSDISQGSVASCYYYTWGVVGSLVTCHYKFFPDSDS